MKNAVISLFDKSGIAVKPWAEAGYKCYCYDKEKFAGRVLHPNIIYRQGDVRNFCFRGIKAAFMFAFPPCTDLAVSGARWFNRKKEANPTYREEAMSLVYLSRDIGEMLGCAYLIENPVSVISSEWRKPCYTFNPYHYTKHHEDDNYTKLTCLWTGGGFIMPPKSMKEGLGKPDSNFIHYLGSKLRGKLGVDTPEGFSKALFKCNNKEKTNDNT